MASKVAPGSSSIATTTPPVRRVLTWTRNPGPVARRDETARIVDTLYHRGYPTPAWRHSGVRDGGIAYAITDLAPGHPGTWSTVSVEELVAAVELQAGAAGPHTNSWSHYLAWALSADDGPRHDLTPLGRPAARFLRLVDNAAARLDQTVAPSGDAVHGDLGIGNILVDPAAVGAQRIAIIDTDACGPGTRALDYAWLYRDAVTHAATAAARRFGQAGRAVAGDDVWRASLALACLELTAFVARNGNPDQATAEVGRMSALLAGPEGLS